MNGAFRQSMGWLHTWGGLVVGWILFFVFLTGTAGYFDEEIDRWMQPERPLAVADVAPAGVVETARTYLSETAPGAERWLIRFPDTRAPDLFVFWRMPPGADGERGKSGRARLDAATGEPIIHRATGGGQLLYQMHYELHYLPLHWAYWLVGVCSMIMLIAIVTGVIIHKRIFRDFFTFRSSKGQRSWLDAHNALSVLALPFHFMITWSGLVFFAQLYMSPVIDVTYGTDDRSRAEYFDEIRDRSKIPDRAEVAETAVSVAPLLDDAVARLNDGRVNGVSVYNPGDKNTRIVFLGGRPGPARDRVEVMYDGTSGQHLHTADQSGAPVTTYFTLLGLHEGLFAGPVLRWLYFLSGLMGTAMIGAGLVLWTTKRRARIGDTLGFRLVERLNIGTVAGLPIAVAAYFWANRLIPVGIEGRAAWEAHAMFIVWGLMLAHAFVRRPARGWGEQLWLGAAAFGLIPVLNWLTTDRHLGVTLSAGAWDLAGFDLTVLALGLAFAASARIAGRRNG